MMPLPSPWRKICVRRETGQTPDAMRSFRTLPGPTDGSWSGSPTITTDVPGFTARKNASASRMSSMDVSSRTYKS